MTTLHFAKGHLLVGSYRHDDSRSDMSIQALAMTCAMDGFDIVKRMWSLLGSLGRAGPAEGTASYNSAKSSLLNE